MTLCGQCQLSSYQGGQTRVGPAFEMTIRVTFFTKPDCTLCNAALYVVERVRGRVSFELESVDISAPGQERWFDAYKHDIPVVHINGVAFCRHRVDERALSDELLRCAAGRRD